MYQVEDDAGARIYFAESDRGKLRHDQSQTFYEHRDTNGTVRRYEQSAGFHLTRMTRPGAGPITIAWARLGRFQQYFPTRISTWTCDDDPTTNPQTASACTADLKKELAYASFTVVLDAEGKVTSGSDFVEATQTRRLSRMPGVVVLGDADSQQSHTRSICYSYNVLNFYDRLTSVTIGMPDCSHSTEVVASYEYLSSGDVGNLTSIRDGAGAEVARIEYGATATKEREYDAATKVTTPGTAGAGEAPVLVTTYDYDIGGQRTVRTGDRISTRYYVGIAGDRCSPDPSHLSRVDRPDGTQILYTYDDYGRLLRTQWPTGREEQWRYGGSYYGTFSEQPLQYRVIPSAESADAVPQLTCYLPDPLSGGSWRSLGPIQGPPAPPPNTPETDPCVYTDSSHTLVSRASEVVANWMLACYLPNYEQMTPGTITNDPAFNAYLTQWKINLMGTGAYQPSPFPFRCETADQHAVWPWLSTAKAIGAASTKTVDSTGEVVSVNPWQRPITTYEYGVHGRLDRMTNPVGTSVAYTYLQPGETELTAGHTMLSSNLGLLGAVETQTSAENRVSQKFVYDSWANTKEHWSLLDSAPPERWIIKQSDFDMRGRVTREVRRSSATTNPVSSEARFGYDAAGRLSKKIVETTDPAKTPTGKTWALHLYEYTRAGLMSAERAWGQFGSATTDPGPPSDWTIPSTGPYSESRTTYDSYGQAIQSSTLLGSDGGASSWAVTRRIFDSMGRLKEERGHETAFDGATPPTFNGDGSGQDWSTRRTVHRYWYDNLSGNLLYEQIQGMDSGSDSTPMISGTTKYVYDAHERLFKTVVCDSPTAGAATVVPGCGSADGLRSSEVHYDVADRPVWSNVCAKVNGQHLLQAWTATDYDERDRAYESRSLDGVVTTAPCSSSPTGPYLKTRTGYDVLDRVVLTAAPKTTSGWAVSSSKYDELGRRSETVDPLLNKVTVTRNFAGLVTKRTIFEKNGSNGALAERIVEFEYDDIGRPVHMLLQDENGAFNRSIWRSFDARGNVIADWAPEGMGTSSDAYKSVYEYDGLGRRILEKRHISFEESMRSQWLETAFEFDRAGRLTYVEVEPATGEGSGGIDGQKTSYEYDALGRQKKRQMPGSTSAPGRTQAVEFDKLGRVWRTKYCAGNAADCTVLESSYDQYSRRTDVSASFTGAAATNISGARYQHFDFDSLDRITRTIDSLDPIATGLKTDDIVTDASFDTLGRIRSESFGNDGSGNTLWPVTSGYNTTGQRTHLTYPAHGTWSAKRLKYTWDDYGRLNAVVDLAADGVTEVETIAGYAYSMGSRLV